MSSKIAGKNDRRQVFGWMVYDWANSAFYTTTISVLIGPFLIALASKAVGEDGVVLSLGLFDITAKGLPAFCLAISVISMVVMLPILGAIADYTHLKKRMMAFFAYTGVIVSALLFFTTESYVAVSIILIVSNMSFAAANVFYNAFLVDLTTEDNRDRVSSYGYAAGYVGGVVMLIGNLLLINNAETLGISTGLAVRISFLAAAVWWGGFAAITFWLIKSPTDIREIPEGKNIVTIGFAEIWETLKELKRLKLTALFLVGYLCYNDGIQTVILMSSAFLSNELFTAAERLEGLDQSFLFTIFLIAQVAAFAGAMGFERIARFIGAKRTIIVSLLVWIGIVVYAYGYLATRTQAMFMGAAIGLVLGSVQALSRSLYSQMIPAGRESSFFGLYEISEKGTAWMGQLTFAIIVGATGSFRHAILGLIVFFIVGLVILAVTNTTRAIHEAGNLTPEEAAD
ncbi:MAG TPA: MFS transporter [Pyrinomonadaceae bacterium]|nr:MFS transporter [Pyrinomonadaceae bacterium]